MQIKNNYNETLTNLACSIRKYFDLEYKHNTLDYIDKILEERKPKNVVTILFDGMGSNIIDRILPKDSFFIKHRIKPITTVFPATTVAATTSMRTGLNPVETGMLGWSIYFKDIDKIINVFPNTEKGDIEEKHIDGIEDLKKRYLKTKSIVKEINEEKRYKSYELFPFGENPYKDTDEMYERIEELCSKDGKKYVYAYDVEPDYSMHRQGTYCDAVKEIIKNREKKVEQLSKKINDTVIFVIADHGHIAIEKIFLRDYPDIVECLKRNTSFEQRAVNFFIKQNKKEKFVELFNKYFGNDFDLLSKQEVIDKKLFGDGEENPIFRSALGDFLAIAKGNKALLYKGDKEFLSHHAGYTEDEVWVPLIVIEID